MKCTKRKAATLALLLTVLTLFSTGCALGKGSSETPEILSILFHQPYLDTVDIPVHYKSDRKKLPDKIASALQKEPVAVKVEDGGFFGKDYYAVTSEYGEYLYYGKIKDNRPNGFGVLTRGKVDLNDLETVSDLIYAGDFKEGLYDGYGATFNEDSEINASFSSDQIETDQYNAAYLEMTPVYVKTYVTYDGNWKKGVEEDKGNFFLLDTGILRLNPNIQEDYLSGNYYPLTVTIAEVKKGYISGDTKQYTLGCLTFEGKTKNGQENGQGTSYFLNGQKEYKGEWKDGVYDGKGTLYDEDGKVIYAGKWKDGDYAS